MNSREIRLKSERELLTVQAIPLVRFENEQLAALTVYSIHWLRKWGIRTSKEAISVLNHRLFHARFSMEFFPEYPDASRSQISLMQCGPKYRGWLSGSNKKGYVITPSGQLLVEQLLRRIGYPQVGHVVLGQASEDPRQKKVTRQNRAQSLDFGGEVARLRASRLFEKWVSGSLRERDLIHVYSALSIFDHTPADAKRLRLNELKDSANKAGDEQVQRLLRDTEDAFPRIFRKS